MKITPKRARAHTHGHGGAGVRKDTGKEDTGKEGSFKGKKETADGKFTI